MNTSRLKKLAGINENINTIPISLLHTKAIDLLDDMLVELSEKERYSEKGDILRYILQRLQG